MKTNMMLDITQSGDNEILLSSENGILIYDGNNWEKTDESLDFIPNTGKIKLKSLDDSSCFALGLRANKITLARRVNNHWEKVELPESMDQYPPSTAFIIDNNPAFPGIIISIGDTIYIYRISDRLWEKINTRHKTGRLIVNKAEMVQDSLLIATTNGLLSYHFANHSFHYILKDIDVRSFLPDTSTRKIYLLGENWLGYYHNESLKYLFQNRKIGPGQAQPATNLLLHKNSLFYSVNSPLFEYNLQTGKEKTILAKSFNQTYRCMGAMIDHEKNLWVLSRRGGFKIFNPYVNQYDRSLLLDNEVSAIMAARDGSLFLGTNSGFQILKPSGKITKYPFSRKLIQPRIMDIVPYNDAIYMAANTSGIAKYHDGKVSFMTIKSKKLNVSDLEVHNHKLYAANRGDLFLLDANNQWIKVLQTDLSPIRKIFFEKDIKYLLTAKGVYDVKLKKIIVSENKEASDIYSGVLFKDSVFLGTKAGVAKIHDGQIVLTIPLPNSTVYSLLTDNKKTLWAGTQHGIFDTSNPASFLNKNNGLMGNEVNRNAFIQLEDGSLAVGTDEGLSIIEPGARFNIPSPKSIITGFKVNNRIPNKNQFRHDQNNLLFTFRAKSYFNETITNYRVRLIGFEEMWQYLTLPAQREIIYPNLEPGTYRFEVQARLGKGEWGPPTMSQPITVRSAFYQTSLFKIIFSLTMGALITILVRHRSENLKTRNQLLKEMIDEKTARLNEQNHQLMQTITNLKTTQGQLIQSEKLASMGMLTAGIAHEMNNPLNYINGGAQCLKRNLLELNSLRHLLTKNGELYQKNSEEISLEFEYLLKESNQLINSILKGANKSMNIVKSLSSITADSQNFFSFIDLEDEIETARTLLGTKICSRITINKMYASIPKIECFPAKINQLVVSILLNSIQAIESDGEITIRLYRKGNDHIRLEISDNGTGITLNNPEQVFEPFFTTKANNPGLGLTIAKSIVQDHKGTITFISKTGLGSKMKVQLPIYQTPHPERPASLLDEVQN